MVSSLYLHKISSLLLQSNCFSNTDLWLITLFISWLIDILLIIYWSVTLGIFQITFTFNINNLALKSEFLCPNFIFKINTLLFSHLCYELSNDFFFLHFKLIVNNIPNMSHFLHTFLKILADSRRELFLHFQFLLVGACLIRMLHGAINDTDFRNNYKKLINRWWVYYSRFMFSILMIRYRLNGHGF